MYNSSFVPTPSCKEKYYDQKDFWKPKKLTKDNKWGLWPDLTRQRDLDDGEAGGVNSQSAVSSHRSAVITLHALTYQHYHPSPIPSAVIPRTHHFHPPTHPPPPPPPTTVNPTQARYCSVSTKPSTSSTPTNTQPTARTPSSSYPVDIPRDTAVRCILKDRVCKRPLTAVGYFSVTLAHPPN